MACSKRWYFPWLPCEFSKDSMKFGMLQKPSKLAGNLNLPYNLDVIPKVFCSLVPVVFPSCLLYWHSVQIFLDPWPRFQQNNFHFGQLCNFQKLLLLEFQVKIGKKIILEFWTFNDIFSHLVSSWVAMCNFSWIGCIWAIPQALEVGYYCHFTL